MYRAFVVIWRGYERVSLRESFESYTQASVWLYEQRRRYGGAFVQGWVL